MKSPIEQFEVVPLVNLEIYESKIDLTITNLFLANMMVLFFIVLLTYYITPKSHTKTNTENVVFFIPNRWQLLIEYLIMTISQLVADNLGNNSEAQKFLPFTFSLFNIILLTNLLGLLPYSFTVTSHLIITFLLSFSVFIGTTIVCFQKHNYRMI
jgi:F0F1-type ATP synthase membrane subunit a